MTSHTTVREVAGPGSLATSRHFREGFAPAALQPRAADETLTKVRTVKGLRPFAAELVVPRGANHPDGLPRRDQSPSCGRAGLLRSATG